MNGKKRKEKILAHWSLITGYYNFKNQNSFFRNHCLRVISLRQSFSVFVHSLKFISSFFVMSFWCLCSVFAVSLRCLCSVFVVSLQCLCGVFAVFFRHLCVVFASYIVYFQHKLEWKNIGRSSEGYGDGMYEINELKIIENLIAKYDF